MARSRCRTPRMISTCRHRIPHNSPLRWPVTIVSQTSVPQSGFLNASVTILAACSGEGGFGFDFGLAGGSAPLIGLKPIHFHFIAFFTAPDMMKWICRMVDHPPRVLAVLAAASHLRVERLHDAIVERPNLFLAEERPDVLSYVAAVGLARV